MNYASIEDQLYKTITRLDNRLFRGPDDERRSRYADAIMRTVVGPALEQARASAARTMRERASDTVAQHWPQLTDQRPSAEQCADVMDSIRALSVEES